MVRSLAKKKAPGRARNKPKVLAPPKGKSPKRPSARAATTQPAGLAALSPEEPVRVRIPSGKCERGPVVLYPNGVRTELVRDQWITVPAALAQILEASSYPVEVEG